MSGGGSDIDTAAPPFFRLGVALLFHLLYGCGVFARSCFLSEFVWVGPRFGEDSAALDVAN